MKHSNRSEEGYLLIDHSASPGTQIVPSGMKYESATVGCSHCSKLIIIDPSRSKVVLHYCPKCDHFICDECRALGECFPIEQLLDAADKGPEKLFAELQRRGIV